MISNNVMSFVKKMVKSGSDEDGSLTSKFRATVAGLSPRASRADLGHLTPEERSILAKVWQKEEEFEKMTQVKKPVPPLTPPQQTPQPLLPISSPPSSTTTTTTSTSMPPQAVAACLSPAPPCRICRKGIQASEPSHTCNECKQLVCDDCASYSRQDQRDGGWRCSCCRRRQSHDRLGPPPGAGMHRVPSVRRMTERIVQEGTSTTGHVGAGGPRGSFMLSEPLKEALRLEMQMADSLAPPSRPIVKRGSYAGQTEWQRNGLRSSSPERRHSYQKQERASSESSLEEEYLPRPGRLRRKSRMQRNRSHVPADEEDSDGNDRRSNTSSSSALDSLEAERTHRLDVLRRYSSESSDVSDLSRGALESSPDERRSIPSVTVDAIGGVSLLDEMRRCSTGSALPRIPIPENQLSLFPGPPHGTGSTHSLDLPREELGKPERRASAPEGDNIKIVIDDVDSGGPAPAAPLVKRILLKRDPADTGARTRGFGMRVMGGKKGPDGHLYAVVAWVLAGSSADLAGLQQGDIILEWNGTSFVDRSYEEVCAVLDKSGATVEILVETGRRMSSRELRASTGNIPTRKSSDASEVGAATRRKLPKTPDELCHRAHVQGELGVRLWYDGSDLEVTVLGARGLPPRRSYVKLRLHDPSTGTRGGAMKTPISEPVANPEWNKTFVFPGQESLSGLYLDLSVWDHRPVGSNAFLGEVLVVLDRSNLRDVPQWFALASRRTRSEDLPVVVDDRDLIKSSSMDSMLLHPDDARQGVERKSSAPSVVYAVNASGQRKQLHAQDSLPELYGTPSDNRERTRSASFKMRRDAILAESTGRTSSASDEDRRRKLSRTVETIVVPVPSVALHPPDPGGTCQD
ncbi:regulating synaptic membrane exocytosis protein 1-like isoform X2 [Ornithodoros turicata]|uniref:regulating synaptic membrane exocytosis protein 1-like isoform X2 n=1 Tax=Ornithodoros turicata TaxID=34597 RepID=UPI003138EE70